MTQYVGIQIDASVQGTAEILRALEGLSGQRAARAYVNALNDVAFQRVRPAMQEEMRSVFDRPTDFIVRSPWVRKATPDKLFVTIEPRDMGGKGVDPQKVLQAQGFGGRRRDKRFESALRRVGILLAGWQAVIPDVPYPGSDDGRGNLRGPFIVQLLAYFAAFGEQGYKANMNSKGRQRVQRGTKKQVGRRYFVSYGRLRGQHLAPGIWAASGTHGVDVRPVVMFVRPGQYKPRLSMDRVLERADAQNFLNERVRVHILKAAGL
jgi:hypothetical protein